MFETMTHVESSWCRSVCTIRRTVSLSRMSVVLHIFPLRGACVCTCHFRLHSNARIKTHSSSGPDETCERASSALQNGSGSAAPGPGGAGRRAGSGTRQGPLPGAEAGQAHACESQEKMDRYLFVPVSESRTPLVPTRHSIVTPTPLLSTLVNPGLKRMRSGRTAPSARSRSPCPPWRPCWQLG